MSHKDRTDIDIQTPPPAAIEDTPAGSGSVSEGLQPAAPEALPPGDTAVAADPAQPDNAAQRPGQTDPWAALANQKPEADGKSAEENTESNNADLWTSTWDGTLVDVENAKLERAFDDTPPTENGAAATNTPAGKPGKTKTPPAPGPFEGKALGPLLRAEPMTRAQDGTWTPTPPTVFSRIFSGLAFFPLLPLLALLAVQVIFTLGSHALWYSDEVRYANAFQNMIQGGHWLVLQLNEAPYPDKPPLFFWFLEGIRQLAGYIVPGGIPGPAASPLLFSIGTALSGLLLLLATHALAVFVGRVDSRTSLAAGIMLLTGFFVSGLLHYLRMDILFAACITLCHVFLFHGWMRAKAFGLLGIGFLLAGTAVLIKGPLGLAFPLLTGIVFLLWQGRFGRFFRLDNLLGIVIGLALPLAWLAAAWMTAGDPFIDNILNKQIASRALNTWHHSQPWYHYFATFPLIFLPWTLLLFFLPWSRLFSRTTGQALKNSRTPETAGLAYLWCAFVPGFILLSLVSIKLPIYCLPLFPPLLVLAARALLRLSPLACKCLQLCLALFFFLLALALLLAPVLPKTLIPIPVVPAGTLVLGAISLLAACALGFLAAPRRAEGMLLIVALFTAAFSYPAWSISAPSLDVFMSPKAQALVIKEYRDAGYYPASFKIYGGTYSYYAGVVHEVAAWEDVPALAAKHPKMILALQASFWNKLADKPEGFVQVNRQTIAEREYVLVARPPLGEQAPTLAAPETKTEPATPAASATATPAAPATAAPEAKPETPAPAPTPETTPAPAAPAPGPPQENAPATPAPAATPAAPTTQPATLVTPSMTPEAKPETPAAPAAPAPTLPATPKPEAPAPDAMPKPEPAPEAIPPSPGTV